MKQVPIIDINTGKVIRELEKRKFKNDVWYDVLEMVVFAQHTHLDSQESARARGYSGHYQAPILKETKIKPLLIKLSEQGYPGLVEKITWGNINNPVATNKFLYAVAIYRLTPTYIKHVIFKGQKKYRYRI